MNAAQNARQDYDTRLQANERRFRAACKEMGFKNADRDDLVSEGRVRVWVNRGDELITILVFSGAAGWSPLQYQIPISLFAPAEIAIATLKATLKATAQ